VDLAALADRLRRVPGYRRLLRDLKAQAPVEGPLRLPRSARGLLAASLADDLRRPVLLVAPRPDRLLALQEEIEAWVPGLPVLIFASPTPLFYEAEPWGWRTITQRIQVLADLAIGERSSAARIILAAAHSLSIRTLAPEQFRALSRTVRVGETIRFERFLSAMHGAGYRPETVVLERGQVSRRGGILDVWPPSEAFPARFEFFGDVVESIRRFDPAEQRSREHLDRLVITPAREGMPDLVRDEWRALLPDDPAEADARLGFCSRRCRRNRPPFSTTCRAGSPVRWMMGRQ
jgi:transcription-repair coupling factor (superfamily II helicase)